MLLIFLLFLFVIKLPKFNSCWKKNIDFFPRTIFVLYYYNAWDNQHHQ